MERWKATDCDCRGTIERVTYTTHNMHNEPVHKYVNVYLPYGYDSSVRYNILYLIHGGGGNPDAWLDHCMLKNILDNMIAKKELEPLIVAIPSFSTNRPSDFPNRGDMRIELIDYFQKELPSEVIPLVESTFSTYAVTVDEAGIQTSRMHRAIGGFSCGSATTWSAFVKHPDKFAWFMPLSGDCWELAHHGGSVCTEETVKVLHNAALSYGDKEYHIFTMTGTADIAYHELKPMTDEMLKYEDTFGPDHFRCEFVPDLVHAYDNVVEYVRIVLPTFFH